MTPASLCEPVKQRRGTKQLKRLRKRFGGKCFYCRVELTLPREPNSRKKTRVTRDHLIPRSKGGPQGRSNVVAACYACNNLRGNMPWLDYLVLIRLRMAVHEGETLDLSYIGPDRDPRRVLTQPHHRFEQGHLPPAATADCQEGFSAFP